jgi:polyhydroxyalkanoate synthase subunit PhaC
VTPDLPFGDVVTGLRREMERNAIRARNGIKYVAGTEWAPRAPTPSDVVWREGKAHLRRYRREDRPHRGPPVVIFIGLVNRATVFDLQKGNSFVQHVMDGGFEAFVLDWGVPDEEDAANTLETYVQRYLPRAIRAVERETGVGEVNLIGYCMGGMMALLALAGQPELPVRNLVTIATPVSFSEMTGLVDALRDGRLDTPSLIDETGNVPADAIANSFRIRKPTADIVQYANLWENLWNDKYMEGFQAMGRWLREPVPFAGAAFRQVVEQWLRGDAFVNNTLRLGGRKASLDAITAPTLAVIATKDHIVPETSAEPIPELLTGTTVEVLRVEAGHAGITAGRTAAKVVLPHIIDWLARHGEEAE